MNNRQLEQPAISSADSGLAQDEKQTARTTMCALAFSITSVIHVYAVKTKSHQIAKATNFSMNDLMAGKASESIARCENIHNLANANFAILADYGVTTVKLALLAGAINSCKLLISALPPTPRSTLTAINSPAKCAALHGPD